jgi:hypothetical protein
MRSGRLIYLFRYLLAMRIADCISTDHADAFWPRGVGEAAKQGWTISCEYADHESGAKRDRIEFQEMFRDAAHRRFDLLSLWSLDRFTREGVLETLTQSQPIDWGWCRLS